jgi:hypothetical protein
MRIWLAGLALTLSAIACSSSLQRTSGEGDGPPKGAAGFDFGAAPSDLKKACEGAGKTWSSVNNESGTCSGPAADFGFDAPVRVDFCSKMSCVIAIEHRPKSNWLAAFNDLKQKLAKEHGTPAVMPTNGIPEKCSTEEQFAQCLEADGLRQEYRWQWPTRQQITFSVGKPEGGAGRVAIRIEYVTPPTSAH